MKYIFIILLSLPTALMAQNSVYHKDTLTKNRSHYLIKDGHTYVFSHEQWLKISDFERAEFVTIRDIQAALKHKGYYNGKIKNTWDKKSLKAFFEFQMSTGLPSFPHDKVTHFKALGLLD